MRLITRYFISLSILIWTSAANAFYNDGLIINSTLMNFDFAEYGNNGKELTEKGLLPGAEIKFGKSLGPVWGGIRGSFLKGSVEYDGKTQKGVPHKTTTDETIYDFTAEIGRNYETWRREEFATIYVGLGFHQWVRDIKTRNNVTGLFERYTWFYANVGARGFLFRTEKFHAMIEINLLKTINPILDVSYRGQYDNQRVDLGEHYGAKLSIPIRYTLSRRVMLYTELYFEAWDLGFSYVVPIEREGFAAGTTQEPRSTSRFSGINLGLFLRFD